MPLFKKNTSIIELTPKNFDKSNRIVHSKLKNKKGIVAYMADWCGHCRNFSPIYEQVADTLGQSFPLFYLDCDKYSEFASNKLGINGFPTIMYIDRSGKPYKNFTKERTEISMLNDICKEVQVCRRI